MNIETRLDLNRKLAYEDVNDFTRNPESIQEDSEAFAVAMMKRNVSAWAINQQIENSYSTAKKIIDTI